MTPDALLEMGMALRDMSEKKLIILTIIVAVVVSIPCWGYFYFVHADYTKATEEWDLAKKNGEDLDLQLKNETKKAARLETVRERFNMQRRMLPEKDEVANFFKNDLPSLLRKNDFQILSLSMNPKIETEKLPKGVDLPVAFRTIEIRITGNYQNMIKLLKEIEEGRESADPTQSDDTGTYRLFRVQSFDFSPSGEKTLSPSIKHQARILLNAFFVE